MGRPNAQARIVLPQALTQMWQTKDTLELHGATLAEALANLSKTHPGLGEAILDDQGKVRRNVLVFVNREPVTHKDPSEVSLHPGDAVHVLPHVAGG